ncbi:BTAD domain-containing putative transcriptional regulator [Nocardiopsis sediminis]|uniref:BTAD domain-containing putative transcriptional regulator n=1 Tax=Nocardiopsis sediminis TaxID=1778267 RepID=A0ABV8FRQ1_9ACTN
MQMRLLGPLELMVSGRTVTPSAPRLRQVLAVLLLRRNTLVQTSELIDELWGTLPPPSAIPTLQTYVYKLRKIFSDGSAGPDAVKLRTIPSGYTIEVPGDILDVSHFERFVKAGQNLLREGRPEEAADTLSRGLAIWRGPALVDVEKGELLSGQATRLEESRLRALELRIEADLQLGRHDALVGELRTLSVEQPLHEGLHAKLMVALHKAGRRYEALEAYRRLRETLVEELGLEPSLEVRRIHQEVLSSEEPLGGRRQTERAVAQSRGRQPYAPAQVPPSVTRFIGHEKELRLIEDGLVGGGHDGASVRVVSISGMPGVGKTALAVHAAHRIRGHFPDGQLFAKLCEAPRSPASPSRVLDGFLRALGVPPEWIPHDLEECGKLFRTCTADRRMLIVLDDAASAAQVEHLMPGRAQSGVIVTNRSHIMPESQAVFLGSLHMDEGIDLLKGIVGAQRVEGEKRAAEGIIRACGGLPLAIRVVGSRLAATPGLPLCGLVRELHDTSMRLDYLRFQGLDLRERYHSSYEGLDKQEQSVFRLLSVVDDGVFSSAKAARQLDMTVAQVEPLLARLVEKHLLQVWQHDGRAEVHYGFHELIKLYARERLEQDAREAGDPAADPTARLQG